MNKCRPSLADDAKSVYLNTCSKRHSIKFRALTCICVLVVVSAVSSGSSDTFLEVNIHTHDRSDLVKKVDFIGEQSGELNTL